MLLRSSNHAQELPYIQDTDVSASCQTDPSLQPPHGIALVMNPYVFIQAALPS